MNVCCQIHAIQKRHVPILKVPSHAHAQKDSLVMVSSVLTTMNVSTLLSVDVTQMLDVSITEFVPNIMHYNLDNLYFLSVYSFEQCKDGSYTCECKNGYIAFDGDGKMGDCVNRDECALGEHNCPTDANGICIDTHPSESGFFCDCIEGYTFFPG